MGEFSQHSDVEAVLQKAKGDLKAIEARYQDCLNAQTIPDDLLVDVKDCIANLRSALDYSWCKVPNAGKNAHFPIANSQADFTNKVQNIDAKYTSTAETHQSYNGNPWLGNFGYIRNKNEHLTLVPQKRKETKEFSVRTKDGKASATFRNTTFGKGVRISFGGVPMPINHETQFPESNPDLEIKKFIWVDFLFDGSSISPDFPQGVSALPFLQLSFANVTKIVASLEK